LKKINKRNRSLSFAPETENETFGKFILQTNEVQTTLAIVIFLYSLQKNKKYGKSLFKRRTLGTLIAMFKNCIKKTTKTRELLLVLKDYNRQRRIIAHEMYLSEKRFNQKDAEQAMKTGKNILKALDILIKNHIPASTKILIK